MRSWLARNIFYPSQDALQGRDSLRYARILERSQWFDQHQLHDLQAAKLHELMRHATGIPYYADLFVDHGVDVLKIRNPEDLVRVPLLTKDDIRQSRERMIEPQSKNLVWSCTSGSTGSPLQFWVCSRRSRSDIANRIRAHRWFDIRPGDPAVYLWGARIEIERQDRIRAVRDWLINEKLLSAFELSDEQLHRYADTFLRMRPYWVYSYASSLWRFAQFVRDCRPELRGVIRKVAFSSGEQMLDHWREEIIAALECSVAEEYGCREGGLIAHECPEGSYHVMAEDIVVEILDEQGQPLPAGQEGRVVVTHLEAYGMPFIRYDTGDRATLLPGTCACGRGLPQMSRPTGRKFEFLETHDGTKITGVSVSRDLKEVDGVAHYRVIQEARDRVRVLVVPNFRYAGRAAEKQIRKLIRARIGPDTEVPIEYMDQLPAHPSGKYRYVVNQIGNQ